jgi:MFS family permease
VFTGLSVNSKNRGASFSLMSLPMPLGAVLGGLAVGGLVTWHGYQLMFAVLGVIWLALPVIGLLSLEDKHISPPVRPAAEAGGEVWRGQTFLLLLLATLLSSTAIYLSRLGTSLSMQALHFSPGAIASTAAVSGIIAIPAILLIGVLSDRLGRRRFLTLSCALAVGGALSLTAAVEPWQFWLASTMLMIAGSVNASVAPALATDILASEALDQGLPWLKTVGSIASILGFASAGYVMDTLGGASLYVIAAALAIVAVPLLGLLPRPKSAVRPTQTSAGTQPTRPPSRAALLTAWLLGRTTR